MESALRVLASGAVIRESLEEIIDGLNRAFAVFESRGLADVAQHGRFAQHRRVLAATLDLLSNVEGQDWRKAEEIFIQEKRLTPYSAALTESQEMIDVLPYIESSSQERIKSKLKIVLSGPQHAEDESSDSNHARNTLFELNIAARLWRAGLAPELGVGADVRCEIGGKRLLIECKRPYANSGVPRGIRDAKRQLRTARKSEPPSTRGVVAISLSRLITSGHKFFRTRDEGAAKRGLKSILTESAMVYQNEWRRLPDFIVAILFHGIAMMDVSDQETYISAQGTAIFPLARPDSLDRHVTDLLHRRLEAVSY